MEPLPVPTNQAPSNADTSAGRVVRRSFQPFSHRPAAYPSTWLWLATGVFRNGRGTIGALLAAWFGMPSVIGLMVLTSVGLGTVGYFGAGRAAGDTLSDVPVWGDVLNVVALHTGGGLGMLSGILVGFLAGGVIGLVLPWFSLWIDDPFTALLVIVSQIVIGALVGFGYLLYAVAFERQRLHLAGARRMSRREAEFLIPLLHDCAHRLALENVPILLIDDTRAPNALAYARHIVVNRGLLDEFDYDEDTIAGILSHELTHWRNADGVALLFIRGVALPLYVPYAAASWVLRTFQNTILRFLAGIITFPIAAAVRFIVMPMQSAASRDAEYRADQGAVLAGRSEGLRVALERFWRTFDGSRNGWDAAVCNSHPPNELRLEHLETPGRPYPLPDARLRNRKVGKTGTAHRVGVPVAEILVPALDRVEGSASS